MEPALKILLNPFQYIHSHKLQRKLFEKCDITSINVEESFEYLQIQESLQSENFTGHCLFIKEYFDMFLSTPTPQNVFHKQKTY